jgi:2-polyprenyl-6-methoxyphenol hydroxylase-like FAD-dependent oxidoreductase
MFLLIFPMYIHIVYAEVFVPKTAISIRLDDELLSWLKQRAPNGYQVLIQDVLRAYRKEREDRMQYILGRAQQVFLQFHARCFWHLRKDLKITNANLSMIQDGLRKYGGLEGLHLAAELDLP